MDSSNKPIGRFKDGDYVIFYDIRGEREIQLTKCLTDNSFRHFQVDRNMNLNFVTMIEYHPSLKTKHAFSQDAEIKNTLSEVITKAGFEVLKVAESEKAVHIGYFMNGKTNKVLPKEDTVIVPSPHNVSSYSDCPEMSANEVVKEIAKGINKSKYKITIGNFANVDVVGHEENENSVIKAVEAVDASLGKIMDVCQKTNTILIVTSDHGTVEEWLYKDGSINTGHTKNQVPFIIADFSIEDSDNLILKEKGELADISPTIIDLIGLEKPSEMTGESLFVDSVKRKCTSNILLLILDGWGLRKEEYGNLIKKAKTPNFDFLWNKYPHTYLKSSGEAVGMPPNTVGNSEAGHLHIGAGRRILLDRVKIDKAIEDGGFFNNEAFVWAMQGAKYHKKALHLLGIVSHYSSHGTIKHLFALLQMAKKAGVREVFVHSLLGRRGEKPESGKIYISKVIKKCHEMGIGEVVSIMGRYWALDREENWDRIEKAYRCLVYGEGRQAHKYE
jgi:2,3-bisphosphoglycerate-independent phosphoglycerate mutase